MQRSLVGIQNDFTEMASSVEDLGDNLFDYFTLVGNRLVPNSEMMVGLGEDALLLLFSASELYQKTMDDALETFLSAREESLKVEKKLLDQQKKVYEDYFSALDRLENQRERKRSREDLVSQLQRLEGATDERSRARALELRRELNQLDEQQAQDAQTQARDALIQGLENSYIEIENS